MVKESKVLSIRALISNCVKTWISPSGNLLDAATKAMMAALRNVGLPEVTFDSENEDKIICDSEKRTPLRLGTSPISCTFGTFHDQVLIDPTDEEEKFAMGSVTIVLSGN